MKSAAGPYDVGTVMSELLEGMNLASRAKEQMCILAWDDIVGDKVSKAAQPEFVKDGRMFVITKSAVWANELAFYKKDFITQLNKHAGGKVIKDIVFRVGRISKRRPPKKDNSESNIDIENIELTEDELARIEEVVLSAGPQMADTMRKLVTTCMRMDKWKKNHGWIPCSKCGVLQMSDSRICPICRMSS